MKYNCPICGMEKSSQGICSGCGTKVKEVGSGGNSMPNLDPMIFKANMEERKELRKFIAEADPLTDVGQVTAEWKRAASALKGVPSRLRQARLNILRRKKAGIEKRAERAKQRHSEREARHKYRAQLSALKAKRAGLRAGTYEAYDNETPKLALPYKYHKRKLKRQYRLGKLQRKLDYLQRRGEYD
jgi:hypothetical protein